MFKNVEVNVLDAGARYGLHPTWQSLSRLANFDLFEPDKVEAARLTQKYLHYPNINIYDVALGKEVEKAKINKSEHGALNSLKGANFSYLNEHEYMTNEFSVASTEEIEITSVDKFCHKRRYDFFKLDVEGFELELLKGAQETLPHVLGIRSEVAFQPIFSDAPLFGDLDVFLREFGFSLLNFDYEGEGKPYSKYTTSRKYGRIMTSDAVWTCDENYIWSSNNDEIVRSNVIRQTLFLLENNAGDYGIYLLKKAKGNGLDIFCNDQDPLELSLKLRLIEWFRKLVYSPNLLESEIHLEFKSLCGDSLPDKHNFWVIVDDLNLQINEIISR